MHTMFSRYSTLFVFSVLHRDKHKQVSTTMSMSVFHHSFFFTALEREEVFKAEPSAHQVRSWSLLTRGLRPLWTFISSTLIPETVAPNAITLFGSACAVQAFYVTSEYHDSDPQPSFVVTISLLIMCMMCRALDGVHAVRCRSATPLGDMFAAVCSQVNNIFFLLTFLDVVEIRDHGSRWCIAMSTQLVALMAVMGRAAAADELTGPLRVIPYLFRAAELSTMEIALLIVHKFVPGLFAMVADAASTKLIYYTALVCALTALATFAFKADPHGSAPLILLSMLPRLVPPFMFFSGSTTSTLSTIADTVCIGMLCVEIYVSKIAKRRIHSVVAVICVCSMFNAMFALAGCGLYLSGMLLDVSFYTGIPLFVPIRNVFIDGVFDLCHIGHKRLMKNALNHGNRLVVGVLADEECVGYKRKPVMTTEERCTEVLSCKFVSEVIAGSPIDGLTEEFIRKHNIHIVVHGEEYDKPDDHYYAVPRRMGITRIAPRTQGMSTSSLIKRIVERNAAELGAKDKQRGGSSVKE